MAKKLKENEEIKKQVEVSNLKTIEKIESQIEVNKPLQDSLKGALDKLIARDAICELQRAFEDTIMPSAPIKKE